MKSIFNHEYQHTDLDAKLVLAFERISQVFKVLLWEQTKKYKLSPIQIQILIYLQHQPEIDRNITTLAMRLNLTKATVSDSVNSLAQKKLILKRLNKNDKRYYYIELTQKGIELVKKIERWGNLVKSNFEEFSQSDKLKLYEILLRLLINFEENEIINRNRICLSCQHLQIQKKSTDNLYFCQVLNLPLKLDEIRIDCPEHKLKD